MLLAEEGGSDKEMVADRCDRCGRTVVKKDHASSSDMVQTHDSFLYLCDIRAGESSRPCLQLKEYMPEKSRLYCLNCLLATIQDWVEEMKKRGDSAIPQENVLLGHKEAR